MISDLTETTNWSYYSPTFEFTKELPLESSAWSGHYFFAYDLVRNLKPEVIVELGTHKGNSLFSMAQAIKDGKLKTKLHGVDTWEGDSQAGYYGEDIYKEFLKISKKYYTDVDIIPHKMFFDDALKTFKNNSIDILHIDGLHTYEAVKHDYDTWLPKVKKDTGIIMFHDVCETKDDFGVYRLWEKEKKKYKNTITFEHYHGLGVVFINDNLNLEKQNLVLYYTSLSKNQDLEREVEEIKKNNNVLGKELEETHRIMEEMHRNLELYKKREEEYKECVKDAEEFRSFKKSKIWKVLSQYRKLKKKIKK